MSAISESIVREFFELHGFLVRQQRKFSAPNLREEEEIDFLVFNPRCEKPATPPQFLLRPEDMAGIQKAVVVVKGGHTETFSPNLLENSPEIFRFVEPRVFQLAASSLGGSDGVFKILVVPALPDNREAREQSIALLKSKGIDGVLSFQTMLARLVNHVETNRNYLKSDVLQMIRILKNYDFIREPQMELFKPARKRKAGKKAAGQKQPAPAAES